MMNKERDAARIKPIDKTSVHRICSGQVILDLATGVKELVENSLDAGATSIDIKLKDYGAESFEVADNGCGVSPENFQTLTLKYHTSKISEFTDLQYLTSFGFRGEALSSLCALGDLTIVTRTKNEPMATQLQYDHSGSIISQKSEARPVGTTVCVNRLFKSLPVRYREFNKNIRREYSRLVAILHAYALMAKGVRLVCTHITGKTRTVILKTQGTNSIKDNIITVFGTKVANCLEPVNISLPNDSQIEGFISKPGSGSGRASGDRQFYYVNNRPVELPKVAKLLNDLYKSFNSLQYPMAVLNFTLPTTAYDVNVTPDKRKVFLHAESELLVALRESLECVYAPEKYTYSVQRIQCTPLEKEDPVSNILPEFETQRCLEDDVTESCPEQDLSPDTVCTNDAVDHFDAKGCSDIEIHSEINVNKDKNASPNEASLDISASRSDLNIFQCKTPVVTSRMDGHCKLGADLAKRGHLYHSLQKVSQSKLTGFLTNSKRPIENESLLSETPLLKKRFPLSPKTSVDMHSLGSHGSFAELTGSVTSIGRLEGQPLISEKPVLKKCHLSSPIAETKKETDMVKCHSSVARSKNLPSTFFSSAPSAGAGENLYISNSMDDNKVVETSLEAPVVTKEAAGENLYISNSMDDNRVVETSLEAPVVTKGAAGSNLLYKSSLDSTASDKLMQQTQDLDVEGQASLTSVGEMTSNSPSCSVEFNIEKLSMKFAKRLLSHKNHSNTGKQVGHKTGFHAASMGSESTPANESAKETALAAATRELEITFNKADFRNMKVLGQFNLGFILAKLHNDIFIIDQHASDEKYNFERLSKTTILNRQPLLRPLPLDLSVAEEVIVMTHLEVFRRNGFDFLQHTDGPPGHRLCLTAVPFSQKTTFGTHDVQELVSLLLEEPSCENFSSHYEYIDEKQELNLSTLRNFIRPSRIRAMLASRACRSSIMIGDALSRKEMEKILAHLAELDSPWNCPHGRPTMRHLVDMTNLTKK